MYLLEIETLLTRRTYVKVMLSLALRSSTFYFIAVLLAFYLIIGSIYQAFFSFPSIILAVGLALVILYYVIWLLYQLFSSKSNRYFTQKYISLGDDDIITKFPEFMLEQTSEWEAYIQWRKVAGCYLLILKKGNMVIIPSSDISASEIPSFESLLRGKIDKIATIRLKESS